MAQLTNQNEDKRDSPALYSENTRPNPLLPHLPINEQISVLEVEAAVKKLRNGKSPRYDSTKYDQSWWRGHDTNVTRPLLIIMALWTSTPCTVASSPH